MMNCPQLDDGLIDNVLTQSDEVTSGSDRSTLQTMPDREELKSLLNQATEIYQANYQLGINAFEKLVEADVMERLRSACDQRMDLPSDSTSDEAFDSKLLSDEDFDRLLSQALETVQNGKTDAGAAMLSVLVALRPSDPRCYIGFGTAMWQTSGVQNAAQFYEILSENWEQPELAYFAADCLFAAQKFDKARHLLERSILAFQKHPGPLSNYDAELFDNVSSLLGEIETQSRR